MHYLFMLEIGMYALFIHVGDRYVCTIYSCWR